MVNNTIAVVIEPILLLISFVSNIFLPFYMGSGKKIIVSTCLPLIIRFSRSSVSPYVTIFTGFVLLTLRKCLAAPFDVGIFYLLLYIF